MKQIFLVEDDEGIREMLEYVLVSQEYDVQSFPTAGEFRKSISAYKPDLILMDVMLPDGNGLEMCRSLSGCEDTLHIPVVLMSAHANLNLAEETCVKDFIAKPFDVEDLLSRVRKQIN